MILLAGAWSTGSGFPTVSSRPVPLLVALRTLEWAKAEHDAGRSPEPFFGQVFDRLFDPDPELVWDVPDQLAANYLKLRGLALAKSGDVSGAVAVLRQAQEKGSESQNRTGRSVEKSSLTRSGRAP